MSNAGQIVSRGDRRWMVRWYVGRDGNGKRRYASETVKGTRKAAERRLREILNKKDEGTELSRDTNCSALRGHHLFRTSLLLISSIQRGFGGGQPPSPPGSVRR